MIVDALHAVALGSTRDASLSRMNIVMETVKSTANDISRDALEHDLHVVEFVDLTGAHRVVAESAHGPAQGAALLHETSVETRFTLGHELLVGECCSTGLSSDKSLFLRVGVGLLLGKAIRFHGGAVAFLVLDDGVVGDSSNISISGGGALEEKRALDNHPPLDGVVLLDNLRMEERNEEEGRQDKERSADTKGDTGDVPVWLLAQTQTRRTLVDDRQGTDGASNEEEARSGPDRPRNGILANKNRELDEAVDDGRESSRNGRRHAETCEDSTETFAFVPAPPDIFGASDSNTDTSNCGD